MVLLEDIRIIERTGKLPLNIVREAVYFNSLFEDALNEDGNTEREEILKRINNDDYVRNNYQSFVEEVARNKRSAFLTPYTAEEFKKQGVQTFQVKGYEIGFALKPIPQGGYDIISVHNNTNIGGLGEALIDSAIRLGGKTLDHFDGYLSDFYSKKGFKEIDRYKWNPEYAPKDWDYEKYGTPDVVMRSLD